jgi:hypothetical protein
MLPRHTLLRICKSGRLQLVIFHNICSYFHSPRIAFFTLSEFYS